MEQIKYRKFKIPKKTGGFRTIEQPDEEGMVILKAKLEELGKITEFKPSYFAHSYIKGRNIVTCAKQHFGNKYIMRVDIKDFFGSISLEKFKDKVFTNNYVKTESIKEKKPKTAIEELSKKIEICFNKKEDGTTYLPQGSPTSPLLSNAFMRFYDWRCAWFCYEHGVVFNRYADDIYISSKENNEDFHKCMGYVIGNLKYLGLVENKKKRKLMKQGKQMNVVGIVCNEKLQIPRKTRRLIRAMKHNAEKNKKPLNMKQKGLINFKDMVDNYEKNIKTNVIICDLLKGIKSI